LRVSGVSERDAYTQAAAAEGHPDNVAAAVHGGLVAVVDRLVLKLPPPDLEVALFVAAQPSPTEKARELLNREVSRGDAVFNAAHVALLVHALYTRDWLLLGKAMDDRLHQPARTELYPWLPAALEAGRSAGAWGAALAGAGPSVFAFCRKGIGEAVAERMTEAAGIAGKPLVTRIAVWS
jgi:homoserine kinase